MIPIRRFFYNNNANNEAKTYGAAYTCTAATNDDNSGTNVQGIYPDGWHLPSDMEWSVLETFIANDGLSGTIGTTLKVAGGWNSDGNGTKNYDFTALPAGYRYSGTGSFYGAGLYCIWWSSTQSGSDNAKTRSLHYSNSGITSGDSYKSRGFNVRCVWEQGIAGSNPAIPTNKKA